jgi:hypothetical protein
LFLIWLTSVSGTTVPAGTITVDGAAWADAEAGS